MTNIQVLGNEGQFNIENRKAHIPELHFDSSQLKNIILSLKYDMDRIAVDIEGEDINIFPYISDNNLIPSGWLIKGSDKLRWKSVLRNDRHISFSSSLSLMDLQFENPDGTIFGDNISFDIRLKGEADLEDSRIVIDSEFNSTRGEFLYDRFYLDL